MGRGKTIEMQNYLNPNHLKRRYDTRDMYQPRSLKSTTTRPAVGGPKAFWEDQRAWRPKNLTAQRAEGTKVLRRQKTGGTINIYQTDRGQTITHLCRWLNLSTFTRFLGGPNGPKICGGRPKRILRTGVSTAVAWNNPTHTQ